MSHPYSTPSGWWVKITDPDTGQDREVGPFVSFDAADDYAAGKAPVITERELREAEAWADQLAADMGWVWAS